MEFIDLPVSYHTLLTGLSVLGVCMLLVRYFRFKRCHDIESRFKLVNRPLSTMSVREAHRIIREMRELEFPYTFHSAMKLSLLKTGAIPTMTKLFVATGQLNEKNASKRAADTEVVLNEVHDREPGSESHLLGIARMNYLHARYRKAGKILDEDMLHTLGSAVVDILRSVELYEWRGLTDVEKCAVGVFHRALGEAMDIQFDCLPSAKSGWRDGVHFAQELYNWTLSYEKIAAKPTESTRTIGRRLVDLAKFNVPMPLRPVVERVISTKLDEHMRTSMGIEKPGFIVSTIVHGIVSIRRFLLRYFFFPRPECMEVRLLNDSEDPSTGLWTVNFWIAHPWYVKPTLKHRWGLKAIIVRIFGSGSVPVENGPYRDAGYDLWTIGPAAQEKRGREEMEAILDELKAKGFASGCPFHP
ncbi:hypothetical protein BJX96DRAFT_182615 [Aspergillus floccosus]